MQLEVQHRKTMSGEIIIKYALKTASNRYM